ncbi:hypothetical protein [Streptomyces sp. NBC_01363]|uniref:hypothetical protein n=1 Tax=Streptomyces sp. NBC_01363 TaxID=2903840 RepID=UPI00224EB425|nr:hypothetical protein [Streptomyces sp. NBC_01363]MCX4734293.1 hypothetical protein [Streptomyces sp. NBC_01363]
MTTVKPQMMPSVYMFQPTEFEDVPVERLDEWEKDLREFVGIEATLPAAATGTTSKCPKKDDSDSRPKEQ